MNHKPRPRQLEITWENEPFALVRDISIDHAQFHHERANRELDHQQSENQQSELIPHEQNKT
jgi:hypothetical protein